MWCLEQMRFTGTIRYTLPWLFQDIDEMDEVFGGDPWPYGFDRNLRALESFASYVPEQRFIPGPDRRLRALPDDRGFDAVGVDGEADIGNTLCSLNDYLCAIRTTVVDEPENPLDRWT